MLWRRWTESKGRKMWGKLWEWLLRAEAWVACEDLRS